MKRHYLLGCLNAGFLILTSSLKATAADEAVATAQTAAQPAQAAPVAARLAFGVDDVVKLVHAQVSEDVIATYIQTSGTVYNLRPNDIVLLHNQGVSDRIIGLMLSQGRVTTDATNQPVVMPVPVPMMMAPPPVQQAATDQPLFIPGQNAAEIAAAYNPVVEEAPSTLYVIPNSGGCAYPTYAVFGGCYSFGCAPIYSVRLGGRHFRSFRRR